MLLCGWLFHLHRGVGEGESPTLCLYLPRNLTISQFLGIYKEIFGCTVTIRIKR